MLPLQVAAAAGDEIAGQLAPAVLTAVSAPPPGCTSRCGACSEELRAGPGQSVAIFRGWKGFLLCSDCSEPESVMAAVSRLVDRFFLDAESLAVTDWQPVRRKRGRWLEPS
jgi:hypothetical protein